MLFYPSGMASATWGFSEPLAPCALDAVWGCLSLLIHRHQRIVELLCVSPNLSAGILELALSSQQYCSAFCLCCQIMAVALPMMFSWLANPERFLLGCSLRDWGWKKFRVGHCFFCIFNNSRKNYCQAFWGKIVPKLYNCYNHSPCPRPAHASVVESWQLALLQVLKSYI